MKTIKEALENAKVGKLDFLKPGKASNMQFIARENKKKPGEPIFVREDGKVGFPTINSIKVKIGDVVRGKVQHEEPTYFLLEVREILK